MYHYQTRYNRTKNSRYNSHTIFKSQHPLIILYRILSTFFHFSKGSTSYDLKLRQIPPPNGPYTFEIDDFKTKRRGLLILNFVIFFLIFEFFFLVFLIFFFLLDFIYPQCGPYDSKTCFDNNKIGYWIPTLIAGFLVAMCIFMPLEKVVLKDMLNIDHFTKYSFFFLIIIFGVGWGMVYFFNPW